MTRHEFDLNPFFTEREGTKQDEVRATTMAGDVDDNEFPLLAKQPLPQIAEEDNDNESVVNQDDI